MLQKYINKNKIRSLAHWEMKTYSKTKQKLKEKAFSLQINSFFFFLYVKTTLS